MPLQIRLEDDTAIMSDLGGLLNDPRYFDATREVQAVLDDGCRNFVADLSDVRELGSTSLALLTTLTRRIRQGSGEIVLARVHRRADKFLEEMRMDTFWEVFPDVNSAQTYFARRAPNREREQRAHESSDEGVR